MEYSKHWITTGEYIEIYITNECNLSCSNCNRFNNYNFKGHYYWDDYETELIGWSKRIKPATFCIIGGEPTLHPELDKWKTNLQKLWPDSSIMIQSNGIHTSEIIRYLEKHEIIPVISVHDKKLFKKHQETIELMGISIPGNDPEHLTRIIDATEFTDCALIDNKDSFSLHNSNPETAFACCSMKNSHTIFKGRLHRCPLLAVLPEFIKQYKVEISDQDYKMLTESDHVLDHDCSEDDLKNFFDSVSIPMDVCKFCPGEFKLSPVEMNLKRKLRQRLSN